MGPVFTWLDDRKDYVEVRHVSIGKVHKVAVVVVALTDRDGRIRLISARPASRKEKGSDLMGWCDFVAELFRWVKRRRRYTMRSGAYGDGDVWFGRRSNGPALKSSYYFFLVEDPAGQS